MTNIETLASDVRYTMRNVEIAIANLADGGGAALNSTESGHLEDTAKATESLAEQMPEQVRETTRVGNLVEDLIGKVDDLIAATEANTQAAQQGAIPQH